MPSNHNRRAGTRVEVHDDIEAVIFAENGFPDFCTEYEINLGGLKIASALVSDENTKVQVSLFDHSGRKLAVNSTVIKCTDTGSIVKFNDLTKKQELILRKMLVLQQALIETPSLH
ncbi:PilZ domain-containing protein [Psychrobium sp. 1_MG-2023]|uniref:PilZ domain-containing protein n=1 Tax=Psychrobium sp. 1_MG-2023 TaxID=3062624 RepID=UPI000C33EF05|nr:PilZ domain-containing protein [Psychrobium sp. 1_MG-2023]MDP2559716.1 PilZ domain-containing protein [Psychrobium sp. 1_MG-2023]PKF59545.1 hypothetical protein CW748_01875 [Alteromonadales bacterium alter-6D02]